jgi:hypothetical protein
MKLRTLITLALVCVALTTVTAQKAKHFDIGLQFGYSNTWIINQNNYGLPELDYDTYWGSAFNFQAGYNFTSEMGLFIEVGMANTGQNYKDDNYTHHVDGEIIKFSEVKRTIDMSYLNIPVFFKYATGEGVARFRLLVGPQFGFLQKAEQEFTGDGEDFSNIEVYQNLVMSNGKEVNVGQKDIKERFNSMDVSIVLDLGADIFVIQEMLYLSVAFRGYYGITDINASDYQVKNTDNNYDPSHNAGGGFFFGVHYIIGGTSGE